METVRDVSLLLGFMATVMFLGCIANPHDPEFVRWLLTGAIFVLWAILLAIYAEHKP